ncbi:MAG: RnfABCDGE type electron transport complex subunit B, partial [Gammaproteobacteria bacterium]|nr:RnfABCDGE type electron transport complex subunit B [Gammaproteobacteria bacterium]
MLSALGHSSFIALSLSASLALLCVGLLLRWIGIMHRLQQQHSLIELINAELPQTQCGQCSHPGCLPYARAIAKGEAINKCPPGG